ncbi:MAG: hypothetical protein J7639_21790, partial [Paenibacillaceae bacterium]|nr:hypothetical protein [Paenibacillaceae bacterium]
MKAASGDAAFLVFRSRSGSAEGNRRFTPLAAARKGCSSDRFLFSDARNQRGQGNHPKTKANASASPEQPFLSATTVKEAYYCGRGIMP